MAAVNTIASTPQNVTRIAPIATEAPPAFAAMPPKRARNTREAKATTGIGIDVDVRNVSNKGSAAPMVKVAAEDRAA